jgi:hypothetical protein
MIDWRGPCHLMSRPDRVPGLVLSLLRTATRLPPAEWTQLADAFHLRIERTRDRGDGGDGTEWPPRIRAAAACRDAANHAIRAYTALPGRESEARPKARLLRSLAFASLYCGFAALAGAPVKGRAGGSDGATVMLLELPSRGGGVNRGRLTSGRSCDISRRRRELTPLPDLLHGTARSGPVQTRRPPASTCSAGNAREPAT